MATLAAVFGTSRGLLCTPLALSSGDDKRLRRGVGPALTFAIVIGCFAATVMSMVAYLLDASAAVYLVAVAIPFVLVQDVLRYFVIAKGQPAHAVISDAVWSPGSVLILAATIVRPSPINLWTVFEVWLGLAVCAMIVSSSLARVAPSAKRSTTWCAVEKSRHWGFGLDGAIGATAPLFVVAVATAVIGAPAAAGLRGASTIIGPLSVLNSAVTLAVVPQLARRGLS